MNETETETAAEVLENFTLYYVPCLVQLGIIGNTLTTFVILQTKLRKLSSSYCLVALAISDNIFLLNVFVRWLRLVNMDIYNRAVFCQVINYVGEVCSCVSIWLVVAFTMERFIAVMYPLQSKSLCTISRAKIVIALLILFPLIFYMPVFFISAIEINDKGQWCSLNQDLMDFASYYYLVDSVLTFALPVSMIAGLNACIGTNIWKFSKIRKRMTKEKQCNSRSMKSKVSSYNLTKMLLIASTVTLVMNLPSYIMRNMVYFIQVDKLESSQRHMLVVMQQLFLLIFNTNYGINFVLYCISGQNFRKAAKSWWKGGKRSDSSAENRTQSTTSSGYKKRRTLLLDILPKEQTIT